VLAIEGVVRRYPGFELGPVDLDVDDDVLAVLGPSGCGKTTLLSVVAGLVEPDEGRVSLDGRDLTGLPPERRGTAMLFQDGALFPHLTARENVAYAADSPTRVDELAERLEIADVLDQRPRELSGGQRGRVALARAIAADPDVLLLDEPLSNLDAPVARRLRAVMRETLAGLGVPAVYVTHDQREAAAVGDRVAVMRDGEIEQVGRPEAVFERPATPFVAAFTGTRNRLPARVRGDRLQWGDLRLSAPGDQGFEDGAAVWLCVRPEHLVVGEGPDLPAHGDGPDLIAATVTARTFEGDGYALSLDPAGAVETLEAWTRSTRETPVPAVGEGVSVRVPADAVHLLAREPDRARVDDPA